MVSTKKHFDDMARIIPQLMKHPLLKYQKMRRYQHAIQMLGLRGKDVVLDVGCGIGYQVPEILRSVRTYIGLDLSNKSVSYFRRHFYGENVMLIMADAENLPFREGVVNVILIIDTLTNLSKPNKALEEVKRVAKDKGRILISVPNLWNPHGLIGSLTKKIRKKQALTRFNYIHNWFNPLLITRLVQKQGLKVVRTRGSFFLPPFFDGKIFLLPPLKVLVVIYERFERILSRLPFMNKLGYHILLLCRLKG